MALEGIGVGLAVLTFVVDTVNVVLDLHQLVPANRAACDQLLDDLFILNDVLQRAQFRTVDPTVVELELRVRRVAAAATELKDKCAREKSLAHRAVRFGRARNDSGAIQSMRDSISVCIAFANAAATLATYAVVAQNRDMLEAICARQAQIMRAVQMLGDLPRDEDCLGGHDLDLTSDEHLLTVEAAAQFERTIRELESRSPDPDDPDGFACFQAETFEYLLGAFELLDDPDLRKEHLQMVAPWLGDVFADAGWCLDATRREVIGSGSFGNVYGPAGGVDCAGGGFAVKVFSEALSSPAHRGAFYRQMSVCHQLAKTGRFVRLHCARFPPADGDPLASRAVAVLERMETDLAAAVAGGLLASEFAAVQVLADTAAALAALHAELVGHFDLRPGHVLLAREGGVLRAKLCDFGWPSTVNATGPICAGGEFRAPEVLRGDKGCRTFPADVYSFGKVAMFVFDAVRAQTGECRAEILEIANGCCRDVPADRSRIGDVATRLEEAKRAVVERRVQAIQVEP
jgi:hypothetical protein